MKIKADTLQKVKELSVVDVISRHQPLKKFGTVYKCRCPFHSEKTSSFTVSPSKNIFKCFGCGKGGDSISYFMFQNFTFYDAVKIICEENHIPFEVEDSTPEQDNIQKEVDVVYEINRVATDFYKIDLNVETKSLTKAKERGFLDSTIQLFEMGHTTPAFTRLYKHLIDLGYTDDQIEKSGVCKRREEDDTFYDVFRDRMMFPIHNIFGKIVGFSGRRNLESMKAKYINSPETRVFKKSKEIFGLYFSKKHITELDEMIGMEGATDVISLFQNGIKNVGGTLGTAFTSDHAKVIKRYTTNLTLLYDGDKAGLRAVFKACEESLKEGLMVKVCSLPEGEDPDSYVKKVGGEEMANYIQRTKKDWIDYRISLLSDSVSDKIKLAMELSRMIALHPDQIARQVMSAHYQTKFGLGTPAAVKKKKNVSSGESTELPTEFHVLRVMLLYCNEFKMANYFKNVPSDYYKYIFLNPDYLELFKYMIFLGEYDVTDVIHSDDEKVAQTATAILNTKFDIYEDSYYDIMSTLLSMEYEAATRIEEDIRNGEIDKNYKIKMRNIALQKEKIQNDINNLINNKK